MALLPRLVLLALVAAFPVAVAPDPLAAAVVANVVLAAAVAVDLARAGTVASVSVERRVPPVVPVGQEAALVWSVGNGGRRRAHLALADHPAPALGLAARRASALVPAGGRVELATTLRPTRRGRHRLTEVTVRLDGPWRLAARQSSRPLVDEVRAVPSMRSPREVELRIDRSRMLEVGFRSARGRGRGTDFEQLREYAPDDDHRRIDWAATARAGKAMVRTYREERNQPVILMVDAGRTMATRVGEVARLEHALDAALAVATVAGRLHDRVGLVAFDRQVRAVVPPRPGRHQVRAVGEALHDVHPELHESDPRRAFVEVLTRFPRRGLLVVLTDLAEEAAAASLLPALPLVVRRHVVLVGGVRDPLVEALAAQAPSTAGEAHLQAAALDVVDERRRVARALVRAGATVVDASPADLPVLLADSYLRVKATGRL